MATTATSDFDLSIKDNGVTLNSLDLDIDGFDGMLEDLMSEYYRRLRNDQSESTADRYTSNVVRWFAWCDDVGDSPA